MTHFRNTFIFPEVKYPFKNSFVVSLKLFKGWWILTGCKCFYCSSAKKKGFQWYFFCLYHYSCGVDIFHRISM